ncbi:hypothetical protein HHL25_05430 [Rhizobium sp. S-51]|uniref:Uncharacterized protein n=1 Tax=Rhizobium terricola TaxID=2728849 RepID=A0A7Y0AU74_9HYPH|nr:hypothetical protein [Rhizobium terricola]NML73566.1 hypothetical protein [Rhizobium terricola]
MVDLLTTLRQRFPASDPRVADLEGAFNNVNSFVPIVTKWKVEAGSNRHLSPAGVASAYRKRMGENVMQEVRRMHTLIKDSRQKLDEARVNVGKPKYDPSDMMAAAHRREIREFLRTVDTSQRLSLVLGEKADPIFAAAALELPTVVSGLPEEQAAMVREVYAERNHPDVLEHIQVREEALEVMAAFASVFKEDVRKQAGIDNKKAFEAWYDTGTEPEAA